MRNAITGCSPRERGDNDEHHVDRSIPVVPEANAGWVLVPFFCSVGNGLVCTVKRTSVSNQQLRWAQLYEKRVHRFNLTVVFVGLIAIIWLSIALWIYLVEVILFRCNSGSITVCSGPLNSRPHDDVGKRLESI
jgi:hypothetical protein